MNTAYVVPGEVRARPRCMEGFWEENAEMDRDQTWRDNGLGATGRGTDASRTGRWYERVVVSPIP
jgi:hypothetical protein